MYKRQRADIVQTIHLGDKDKLIKFCQGIQKGSPIDSDIIPYPGEDVYKRQGIGLSFVKAIMNNYGNSYGVINHDNGVEFYIELDLDLN